MFPYLSANSLERKSDNGSGGDGEAKAAGLVTGLALVCVGIAGLFTGSTGLLGSSTKNNKMMKAPSRDNNILRKDFEKDPSSYFRTVAISSSDRDVPAKRKKTMKASGRGIARIEVTSKMSYYSQSSSSENEGSEDGDSELSGFAKAAGVVAGILAVGAGIAAVAGSQSFSSKKKEASEKGDGFGKAAVVVAGIAAGTGIAKAAGLFSAFSNASAAVPEPLR